MKINTLDFMTIISASYGLWEYSQIQRFDLAIIIIIAGSTLYLVSRLITIFIPITDEYTKPAQNGSNHNSSMHNGSTHTNRENKNSYDHKNKEFYEKSYKPEQIPGWSIILGVAPTATKQEIKIAYRNLVKRHHPDRLIYETNQQRFNSEEFIKCLNEAYDHAMSQVDK